MRPAKFALRLLLLSAYIAAAAQSDELRRLQEAVRALNDTVQMLSAKVDACCAAGQAPLDAGSDFPMPKLYRIYERG